MWVCSIEQFWFEPFIFPLQFVFDLSIKPYKRILLGNGFEEYELTRTTISLSLSLSPLIMVWFFVMMDILYNDFYFFTT